MLLQTGPPPAPPPGPRALTLFDTLMAGGCIGFLVLATTLLGLLLGLVFLLVFKRRGAIIATAVLSVVPIALGLLGTAYGFMIANAKVAEIEAQGGAVSPAELAESHQFALITTWMGLGGSTLLLGYVLAAVLLKRRPEPPAAGS